MTRSDLPDGSGRPSPTSPPPLPPIPDAPSRETLEAWVRERLAPVLAVDRGSVGVASYAPGVRRLVLVYRDACAGCPGLDVTHLRIVVPLLRRAFPGIDVVESKIEGEKD